jgi:hypothetical protein
MIAPQPLPRAAWSGTVVFGEIDVAVRVAGAAPAAWPAEGRLRIVATQLDRGGRAPLSQRAVLVAAPGSERAYGLLTEAMAIEGMAAVLDAGDGTRGARLRAIAGALVYEAAGVHVDEATGSEEELALALALLRAFPRAIAPAVGAEAAEAPADAPVIDLSQRRQARATAAAAVEAATP